MGTPVFLKFARLVGAVLFVLRSANFIYASLSATKHGIALDFAVVEAAQTWSIYMSSGLQLFHNSLVLAVACCLTSLTSLRALAGFISTYTGRISSTRYGSSLLVQVRPRFLLLHCYVQTLVASHQPRCPRREYPTLPGPSARIISLTRCSLLRRPSCLPQRSSTRQKQSSTSRVQAWRHCPNDSLPRRWQHCPRNSQS